MANLLFDLMQKRKVNLPRRIIDMYFRGLKVRSDSTTYRLCLLNQRQLFAHIFSIYVYLIIAFVEERDSPICLKHVYAYAFWSFV